MWVSLLAGFVDRCSEPQMNCRCYGVAAAMAERSSAEQKLWYRIAARNRPEAIFLSASLIPPRKQQLRGLILPLLASSEERSTF